MSLLFAYIGGRGWGLGVLKCFVRGVRIFSTFFVCGGGGQVQYISFREKNNRDRNSAG